MSETRHAFSIEQVLALLRQVELFQGLPEEQLRKVAAIVGGTSLPAGAVLFEEGEPGDAFYIVYRGAVEIVKHRPGGAEEKLAVRRGGEAFGEMALLNDAPRSATARAVGDTQLMTVARGDFEKLLGGDSLELRLMRLLSKSLRALGVRFAATEKLAERSGPASPASMDDFSRVLQRGLLPRNAPRVEGYDIAAGTTTEDGGRGTTIWDWTRLRDGSTVLVALDVRSEGLPPAFVLGTVRVAIRAEALTHDHLEEVLPRVNAALTGATIEGVEQHVECGLLVPREGGIQWAGAGRMPGGLIRRDGTFEAFDSHGPPLGVLEGFQYGRQSLPMGPGDQVIVLSKGSTGLFRGAADLVSHLQGKPAGEVVATLHRAIRKAGGQSPQETSVLFVRKH